MIKFIYISGICRIILFSNTDFIISSSIIPFYLITSHISLGFDFFNLFFRSDYKLWWYLSLLRFVIQFFLVANFQIIGSEHFSLFIFYHFVIILPVSLYFLIVSYSRLLRALFIHSCIHILLYFNILQIYSRFTNKVLSI